MTETTVNSWKMPAEWAKHQSVWLAWPSDASLWLDLLPATQSEFVSLCEAICDLDPKTRQPRGESLEILVHPDFPEEEERARKRLGHLPVRFHRIGFGDIWLRDTAPLFLVNPAGEQLALRMKFNSWGNKYDLAYDPDVAANIIKATGIRSRSIDWISEGGSLEFDGEGTCLTSKQCLLGENRNPQLNQKQIENIICENFGVKKVLWVSEGLINDHTDGHIDTIARYVAPGVIMVMEPSTIDDPNSEIFNKIILELEGQTDAQGRPLKVVRIPSPGNVVDDQGEIMPASYLNFYIGNSTVIVPTYGQSQDNAAVAAIAKYFPEHRVVGRSAKAILGGGGAFHCITQQVPAQNKN